MRKIVKDGTIREYDEKGNLIHFKNSNGNEYWYEYNEKGRCIHVKYSIKDKDFIKGIIDTMNTYNISDEAKEKMLIKFQNKMRAETLTIEKENFSKLYPEVKEWSLEMFRNFYDINTFINNNCYLHDIMFLEEMVIISVMFPNITEVIKINKDEVSITSINTALSETKETIISKGKKGTNKFRSCDVEIVKKVLSSDDNMSTGNYENNDAFVHFQKLLNPIYIPNGQSLYTANKLIEFDSIFKDVFESFLNIK